MGTSNLPNRDEMEIQMKKRIDELEKVNKELHAENIELKQDINKLKGNEEALQESEQCVRLRLESDLAPSRRLEKLELADIIDIPAVQSIMDDFYEFAHITMALLDLKGNILVGVGWQDICTKFHRVHPKACRHCVESDTKLSAGVPPEEFKLYKCKNNMWDIVTPIIVDGQHIGNIFSGQFFFEDEPVDYELFRVQARKYGFDEEEYIAALERVPKLSRETVERSMSFFMKLANVLSQLSHSNIKLSQSLVDRDAFLKALQESERRERARSEELEAVLDAVPVAVFITDDPLVRQLTGNRLSYEWLRVPVGTNFSKSAPEGEKPEFFNLFKDGMEIPPEKMPSQMAAAGREIKNCELDIVSADGDIRHVLGNARPLRDEQGNLRGSVSAFIDITEHKIAEKALRKSLEMQKTLIAIINKSPAIAFLWKNMENWPVEFVSENVTQLGYTVEDFISGNILYGDIIHKEDIEAVKENLALSIRERHNSFELEYRIFTSKGEIRWVEERTFIRRNSEGEVTHFQGVIVDVTERKKTEENLKKVYDNLEKLVEERTAELEKAYNSLKESEKRLAEAQKIAHIGSWDWDLISGEVYWSNEMYSIFGLNPQRFGLPYKKVLNYIHPEDREYLKNAVKRSLNKEPYEIDYRIVSADGIERTAYAKGEVVFNENNVPVRIRGTVQDITERKKAEEAFRNLEIIRKKEIHHRIKNNLQVISSLLDLQAEKFGNREFIMNSEVLEAFRESQDRVASIALIHEELHENEGANDTLNFSLYLQRLVESLFQTYKFGNTDISLNLNLEENIFFDMDAAVPLGIIVNELVSNSLKYAFSDKDKGEIQIKLHREEKGECKNEECENTSFAMNVSDNGVGIPENLDIENIDSLGLQLVASLVDQLDGEFELKRNNGTEFTMRFTVTK